MKELRNLNNGDILVSSAVKIKNYDDKILFTLKDFDGLWVGRKIAYDEQGHYNSSIAKLELLTTNEKLYSLLNGDYSYIALAGFIYSNSYNIDDIKEFYELAKKLNMKYYEDMDEKDNEFLYKLEERKKNNT